jgi:ATP-binding cassette subfamily B protein/ATP-binding cassette subfamily C protein
MGLLLVMTIGFSLIETLGISAIMPFISLASDPGLLESGWYKKAFDFIGSKTPESFIIALGIGIIIFYLFRAVYSVFLTLFINRFSAAIYKYFSKITFRRFLFVSYRVYAQRNSAEIMNIIGGETSGVGKIILNVLQLCSELFTILLVYMLIILLNWKMTLIITAVLVTLVILFLSILTGISRTQGEKQIISSRNMNRSLKESLGNFKFVKLKGNEDSIIKNYDSAIDMRTKSEVISNVAGVIPKNILESIGFSFLIGVVVFILWLYHDASKVIPIISMYALAMYRILPSIHRLIQNVNNIAFNEKALENVHESLNQPVENEGEGVISFNNCISLNNVSFKYMTGAEILNGITLEIKKGEKIAFTGESGSGKSTLIDIITGIHKPISGNLYIDNIAVTDDNIRSWRKKIGYIPQSIYLFDGTVAENVSFGSKPDEEKIIKALQMANIWDFLCQKEGLHTRVGDGGIQLSGGQQQRIGIARALYDNPEVLVLDEATSALDTETEQKIMDEIYTVSANKTLIVIAHRLSTVERCNRKIRIENGRIV